MTRALRRDDFVYDTPDIAIRLRDRNDFIVRHHQLIADVKECDAGGLIAMVRTWRRRYVTRRQLGLLDASGLADIGLDTAARNREVAKAFWQP